LASQQAAVTRGSGAREVSCPATIIVLRSQSTIRDRNVQFGRNVGHFKSCQITIYTTKDNVRFADLLKSNVGDFPPDAMCFTVREKLLDGLSDHQCFIATYRRIAPKQD
jgi:hypothetical protein